MKPVHRLAVMAACAAAVVVILSVGRQGTSLLAGLASGESKPPAALSEAAQTFAPDKAAKVETRRDDEARESLGRRLASELRGEGGDLSRTLKQLGRRCGGLAPSSCLDGVMASLPSAERERLADILARLPLLGPHLSSVVMTTRQPMMERIDAVSQARAQVLGETNARLLFGREEAQLRYQARLDQFTEHEAAGMPLAQRMVAAEAMRPEGAADADDATEHARRYALTLRLTLLDAATDADRDRLTREVRSRFFTPEQADALARGDQFDAQQRDRMSTYGERRQAIQARYADISDPATLQQRDAELAALRQEMFPDSFQPH